MHTCTHVGMYMYLKMLLQGMQYWGEILRDYYGKDTAARDSDFVNNYLGYWTDNGNDFIPT